jgi:pyruvate carboxylase
VAAYLDIPSILRVAKSCGADAVHPGYGFLSENPDFAEACEAAGIAWIGPTPATMRLLGDKASARRVAIEAGVPVVPASEILPDDSAPEAMAEIRRMAGEIGYPLMLKASWGGGGRGMRPIMGEGELEAKVREGRREAEAAFGNGEGYLEKMIPRARHVEVQVLGDLYGEAYHLYERDCTVQRRNQKVVERAPAPYLSPDQRAELCELGLRIARHAHYHCAGTVEFLQDADTGRFHFIEVNPRIQVEHTVTEQVTGIDLVEAQFRIASGESLADLGLGAQEDVPQPRGYAIQARVVALGAGVAGVISHRPRSASVVSATYTSRRNPTSPPSSPCFSRSSRKSSICRCARSKGTCAPRNASVLRAARRTLDSLLAPATIGGRGSWTGLGLIPTSSNS